MAQIDPVARGLAVSAGAQATAAMPRVLVLPSDKSVGTIKADGVRIYASMTAGSNVVTGGDYIGRGFQPSDVGKLLAVTGAGPSGANLSGYIGQVLATNQVTLVTNAGAALNASTTVGGKNGQYCTDDTSAFQAYVSGVLAHNGVGGFGEANHAILIDDGYVCISQPISLNITPFFTGFLIQGRAGRQSSGIVQFGDNSPIFTLTSDVPTHSLVATGFSLNWATDATFSVSGGVATENQPGRVGLQIGDGSNGSDFYENEFSELNFFYGSRLMNSTRLTWGNTYRKIFLAYETGGLVWPCQALPAISRQATSMTFTAYRLSGSVPSSMQ